MKKLLIVLLVMAKSHVITSMDCAAILEKVVQEFHFWNSYEDTAANQAIRTNMNLLIHGIKNTSKESDIVPLLTAYFKKLGYDSNDVLIMPLMDCAADSLLKKKIKELLFAAMVKSVPEVHSNTIGLILSYYADAERSMKAYEIAQAAAQCIGQVSPMVIKDLALEDEKIALFLAQAALKDYAQVNTVSVHTIPMLACLHEENKKILSSLCPSFSPLDAYLINNHSDSGAICSKCRGPCRFKQDTNEENLAKLIKGARVICDTASTDYNNIYRTLYHDDKLHLKDRLIKLLSLPNTPTVFCSPYAWFVSEGQKNAQMHALYIQEVGKTTFGHKTRNDYLFGKILGYHEEDIQFFYYRIAKLEHKAWQEEEKNFLQDKANAQTWLGNASQKIETMSWNPKKLIDVISSTNFCNEMKERSLLPWFKESDTYSPQ